MLSNFLAEIWGISIVVISLAFLIEGSHLKRLFKLMDTEDNFFEWGLISFVIGLVMVLSHNVWVKNWQVVVTVLGWISLLKGLFLLFAPRITKKWAKNIENLSFLPFILIVTLIIGLALTYVGFTA